MRQTVIICRVREYRTRESLTQEDLAQSLGISRQSIIALESGQCTPSLGLALQLMHYFDVPFTQLFQLPGNEQDEDESEAAALAYPPSLDTEPRVNVIEGENTTTVEASVPGFNQNELEISVNDSLLTISGKKQDKLPEDNPLQQEFTLSQFSRAISLPHRIDPNGANARLNAGILTVTFPNQTTIPKKIRTIEISSH
jgi:HSP20 family molecular chaperone IbpA